MSSPPLQSRTVLPPQRREGFRSLVVGALPPRIPPSPHRNERVEEHQKNHQQRVNHQPPPPGSLRPRMVEKSDPRRYRQAKKEQDSHRRLLLQHQPTGRHISPRRSQPAISPLVTLVVQPHRMVVSTQLR